MTNTLDMVYVCLEFINYFTRFKITEPQLGYQITDIHHI